MSHVLNSNVHPSQWEKIGEVVSAPGGGDGGGGSIKKVTTAHHLSAASRALHVSA
jgi:hypothetical protein